MSSSKTLSDDVTLAVIDEIVEVLVDIIFIISKQSQEGRQTVIHLSRSRPVAIPGRCPPARGIIVVFFGSREFSTRSL